MTETDYELTFEADGIAPEKLPRPIGWRILIAPVEIREKSTGGIILPEQVKNAMEYFRDVGKVVAMGPECYKHAKFNGGAWCKVGDIVQYSSYAGKELAVVDGDMVNRLKVINDDEVLTVVDDVKTLNFL